MVSFTLPANYEGYVQIRFEDPWYWSISFVISVLTVLWLLLFLPGKQPSEQKTPEAENFPPDTKQQTAAENSPE